MQLTIIILFSLNIRYFLNKLSVFNKYHDVYHGVNPKHVFEIKYFYGYKTV